MKTSVHLYTALLAAAAVQAQEPTLPQGQQGPAISSGMPPAQPPNGFQDPVISLGAPSELPPLDLWNIVKEKHNQVKPIPHKPPVTVTEKAAMKFKPMLHVSNGCQPYPAINEAAVISGGLEGDGDEDGDCKGSGWGAQIYGRSGWYRDKWAMMYAAFFPKDMYNTVMVSDGIRYDWEHVIVWLDNPASKDPKILAVTPWDERGRGYSRLVPPGPDLMNGTRAKLNYGMYGERHMLSFTTMDGDDLDLIMWDQLPPKARQVFNAFVWTDIMMPLSDPCFQLGLQYAYPFDAPFIKVDGKIA